MQASTHRTTLGLLAAALALAATAARAAEPPPHVYITGEAAWNRSTNLSSSIDGALAAQGITSSSSVERSNTNPSLRLGYAFNRNFALEASYDRVGNSGVQSAITSPAADSAAGRWHARGLGLHAVATAPIDAQWSVFGRAGIEHWRSSLQLASTTGGATAVDTSGHNTSLALGAGASYAIAQNLDAVGEFTRYTRVGDDASGHAAVNQLGLGLRYHFN